jgi:sodium-dependent dicarboxylate transporter 2/3/5
MKSLDVKKIGLIGGPLLFLLLMMSSPISFSTDQWRVICLAVWMLIWWITESAPIAVTALLPILLLPALGVFSLKESTAPYGSDIVFLFFGGFVIAIALEKWNVHRRIAMNVVKLTGTKANRIILGFMLATGALSLWISNTACAVMMLPMALSVIDLLRDPAIELDPKNRRNFAISLLLGIAYAANAGGIGTLIGTPPNLVMAGFLKEQYGIEISFLDWMKIGLPFAAVLLMFTYWMLVKFMFPNRMGEIKGAAALINNELKSLGKLKEPEFRVLVIFVFTALLWTFRSFLETQLPFLSLSDTGIAVLAAILLFVLPSGKKQGTLLHWDDTSKLPWGILLLFGGGLALAAAFQDVGLVTIIGETVVKMQPGSAFGLMLLLSVVALFMTEVMSNVALTTIFVPVVSAIGVSMGLSPEYFAIPVTIAASCAYMLPMATPPNAIVFASGEIRIADMAKAGFVLNLIAAGLIAAMAYFML